MTNVYDLESFPNIFVAIVKELDNDTAFHFEIGPDKNDLDALVSYFFNRKFWLVSYNGLDYDDPMMAYLWKNRKNYSRMSGEDIAYDLYQMTEKLINNIVKPYEVKRHAYGIKWKPIDLLKYKTRLIIKSKHVSLKAYQNLTKARDLRDLPYEPGTVLNKEQRLDLISYGYNDVEETARLYFKMKNEVNLRVEAGKLFFSDNPWLRQQIMSIDSVNMGMLIMMYEYEKLTGLDRNAIKERTQFNFKPVSFESLIYEGIEFKDPKLKEVLWIVKQQVKHPTNGKFKHNFYYNSKSYTIGLGGIHTSDDSRVFRKDKKRYFSIDAESYYPHLIKRLDIFPPQLGKQWLDLYWQKFLLRRKHKKLAKTTGDPVSKTMNSTLKLLINGASGNLKSVWSPLYHPIGNIKMTLNGQLLLIRLVEMMKDAGIYTESVNTDGILVEIDDSQYDTMLEVAKEWEKILDIPLEVKEYKLIVRHSVNKYFAVDEKDNVEAKGEYITEPLLEFFHSRDGMVIRKAFADYFLKGTQPEDYIMAEKDPLEFTFCPKSSNKFVIVYRGQKQQKVNRFAVGIKNKGAAGIYKCRKEVWENHWENKPKDKTSDISRAHDIPMDPIPNFKDIPVVMMNKVPEGTTPEDYYIDRDWYIRETYKWIREVEPIQQQLFLI